LQIVIKGAKEKALKAKGFPKVETTSSVLVNFYFP
jgi:hypothetical protein